MLYFLCQWIGQKEIGMDQQYIACAAVVFRDLKYLIWRRKYQTAFPEIIIILTIFCFAAKICFVGDLVEIQYK